MCTMLCCKHLFLILVIIQGRSKYELSNASPGTICQRAQEPKESWPVGGDDSRGGNGAAPRSECADTTGRSSAPVPPEASAPQCLITYFKMLLQYNSVRRHNTTKDLEKFS